MATSGYKSKAVGSTIYGQNVLVSIIKLATKEIEGIASLYGKGVRLQINGKKLVIEVFVNVFSHVQCNDVAFRVQENIKQSVESATDYKVDVTNVNVLGVCFFDEK